MVPVRHIGGVKGYASHSVELFAVGIVPTGLRSRLGYDQRHPATGVAVTLLIDTRNLVLDHIFRVTFYEIFRLIDPVHLCL